MLQRWHCLHGTFLETTAQERASWAWVKCVSKPTSAYMTHLKHKRGVCYSLTQYRYRMNKILLANFDKISSNFTSTLNIYQVFIKK
jgi:hypothetical protein